MRTSEDWWAIWLGGAILAIAFATTWISMVPADSAADKPAVANPFKPWLGKTGSWESSPGDAFRKGDKSLVPGIAGTGIALLLLYWPSLALMGRPSRTFPLAFMVVFLLATLAYVLAGQVVVKQYNLEFALWALLVGLILSNTVGTPAWLRPAALTEFYIKTGLVLLGAEVLMSRLLVLGLPGIFVAWVVTPVVLVSTFLIGQKLLRIASPSLNMVISADMSVCGVSAAIATAAACKAKKEELSLAIAMSLTFTVVMMVVQPLVVRWADMDEIVGGAWIGGTIDSTGAVAAAGALLGDRALQVAATVKMIQNILIGVVAFCVAVYWVTFVERDPSAPRPGPSEIWRRFPKFVLGFVAASAVFSLIYAMLENGPLLVDSMIADVTGTLRGWLFCLAFVSIGLETNFRELARHLQGGRPLLLYILGQSLNLVLTLLMAWLMFGLIFRSRIEALV